MSVNSIYGDQIMEKEGFAGFNLERKILALCSKVTAMPHNSFQNVTKLRFKKSELNLQSSTQVLFFSSLSACCYLTKKSICSFHHTVYYIYSHFTRCLLLSVRPKAINLILKTITLHGAYHKAHLIIDLQQALSSSEIYFRLPFNLHWHAKQSFPQE